MSPDRPDGGARRRSILSSARTRILVSYVALLVFATAVSFVALRQLLLASAGERVDDALVQETEEFRRLVRDGRDPRTGKAFGSDIRAMFDVFLARNVPSEGEALFTFIGQTPYRASFATGQAATQSAAVRELAGRGRGGGEFETNGRRVRYLAVPIRLDGGIRGAFAVTIDLDHELDEVRDASRLAAAVSLGVLLLASVLAWIVAGRVLRPLRLFRKTARAISESDLTRRIPVRGDDELAELARTFNAMLDRLQSAFASQKAFISDAGHELRTPITIIRGHLELLGDDPHERRETVQLVTDELDRMSRFVEDLLLLAKAERPDFLRLEELDLDLLARELFAKASALGPRDWQLARVGAGRVVADRQRLTQAIVDLGHNAVENTRDGDRIALGAELRDGTARLWVSDTGPGVEPEDRERIFERFARGTSPRHEGSGLGLPIVRAIAEAHGGHVELDTRPPAGSTFTVVIPAQPPARAREVGVERETDG
jgi:two-component system OmpR family sensor kinase